MPLCSHIESKTPFTVESTILRSRRPIIRLNSRYDIGTGQAYGVADSLKVIKAFSEELTVKRGIVIDTFLLDDGWDDRNATQVWSHHKGWPAEFLEVSDAAAEHNSTIGVWLSPWGGYAGRDERVTAGIKGGYEVTTAGEDATFVFSGPKYFARFRERVKEMVTKYGGCTSVSAGFYSDHCPTQMFLTKGKFYLANR